MTPLLALLLALPGPSGTDGPAGEGVDFNHLALAVDPCVDVDEEQVRRLVAMELRSSRRVTAFRGAAPQIAVGCADGVQEVRVVDADHRSLAVRTVDLIALESAGRDAKTRELALAIAELVRRSAPDVDAQTEAPVEKAAPSSPPAAAVSVTAPPPPPARWRVQAGALFAFDHWSGGYVQMGPEVALRWRAARRLLIELRAGGRRGRTIAVTDGQLEPMGLAGALGLALDLTPERRRAGVALGARLGVDWLRFTATSDGGATKRSADVAAAFVAAGPSAFVVVAPSVRLLAEATAGTALHRVTVRDQGIPVSAISGLGVSGTVGLVAQF